MIGSAIILAALLIRLVPISVESTPLIAVSKSANGFASGQLLVKFDAQVTQLGRLQAVNTALQNPVRVTTLTPVTTRTLFGTTTQLVTSVSQGIATVESIEPVVATNVPLVTTAYATRASRGTPADVQATAQSLRQWYVLRVSPATADLAQIAAALAQQAGVSRVEKNYQTHMATVRSVSSTSVAGVMNLADAQLAVRVLYGDVTGDGVVDGKDLRALINYMFNNGPQPQNLAAADVNHDGSVNIADLTNLVSMLTASLHLIPKDLTGDGQFTVDDVNFMAAYVMGSGPAPSPLSNADVDGDGSVDISDLTMMVDYLYGTWANGTLQYGRGDVNADGTVDSQDVDALVDYMFNGGAAPQPLTVVDMNLDEVVDVSDLTMLVELVYGGSGNVAGETTLTSTSVTSTSTLTLSASGEVVSPMVRPTYLMGDSNADGRVTMDDVYYIVNYFFKQGPAPSPSFRADMNGDGALDIADLVALVHLANVGLQTRLAAADVNSDGQVNLADLTALRAYMFNGGAAPDLTKADVTGDGSVDIADLTALSEYLYTPADGTTCPDVRTAQATTFLNGDVNGDGNRTAADLTALAQQVYAQGAAPSLVERADVNCDGVVNGLDVIALGNVFNAQPANAVQLTRLPGDFNQDGAVNHLDIAAGAALLGTNPVGGDVNLDSRADFRDLVDLVHFLKLDRATVTLPDLTGDGAVTWADAQLVAKATMQRTGTVGTSADVNGDGTVDAADGVAYVSKLQQSQAVTSVLGGDVTADGSVDCHDATALYASFYKDGAAPSPIARGDVNNDGKANLVDMLLLAQRSCPSSGNGTTSSDIRIALLDTGAATAANALKGVLAPAAETLSNSRDDDKNGYVDDSLGWNTLNENALVSDCNGHGTALAQMLTTPTGMSESAKVIPVKVLDCQGNGTALSAAQGLVYAAVRGADIAEMPFSGVGSSALLADVVRYVKASGMFVTAAAGNDGVPVSRVIPGNVAGVLAVGATTDDGTALASYSNTSSPVNAPGSAANVSFIGTSVSTTYVTGTAALVLTKQPALNLTGLLAKLLPSSPTVLNVNLLDVMQAVQ